MLKTILPNALGNTDIPPARITAISTHLASPSGLPQERSLDTLLSLGSDSSPQSASHCFAVFFDWAMSFFSVISNFFMTIFCCSTPELSVLENQRAQEPQLPQDSALGLQVLENRMAPNSSVQRPIVSTTIEEETTVRSDSKDVSLDAALEKIRRIENEMPEFPSKEELAAVVQQVSSSEELEQKLGPLKQIIFNRLSCLLEIAKIQKIILSDMSDEISNQ